MILAMRLRAVSGLIKSVFPRRAPLQMGGIDTTLNAALMGGIQAMRRPMNRFANVSVSGYAAPVFVEKPIPSIEHRVRPDQAILVLNAKGRA